MNNTKTQIQISVETRERLKRIGTKGQSYENLLKQLIDLKEQHKHA